MHTIVSMQLATDKSPKLTVPFRYLFTGIGMLILAAAGSIIEARALALPYFGSPVLLTLTHLVTLGWITMTIMGAMFQLVPVITEQSLFSERMARFIFYVYLAGVVWLVSAFAINAPPGPGAGLVSSAVLLFLADSALTMRGMKKPDLAVWYVVAAMAFLFVTLMTGSLAAAGLHRIVVDNPLALLYLHIAGAGIGWVCFIIIGFSFRLIPMFILSHGYDESYGWTSLVLLTAGLLMLMLNFVLRLVIPGISGIYWLGLAGGGVILAGIISYLVQMRLIFSQRARRQIEPAIWFALCATGYLLLAGLTGVWMLAFRHSFRVEVVYVVFGLLGFAGMYIIGMMHKIVPFLQWYNKYSSKIGLEKVPMTKDMISERLTWIQLFVFNGTILLMVAGILKQSTTIIRTSGILLLAGALMFLWNIGNVVQK